MKKWEPNLHVDQKHVFIFPIVPTEINYRHY